MTERQGNVRPGTPQPGGKPAAGEVLHKATRECPITQPHPEAICGIVQARRRRAAAMTAARGVRPTGNDPGSPTGKP